MPKKLRRRERIFWPACHGSHYHWGPYPPFTSPGWVERPTQEEEAKALKEHIEMLKEEMAVAEEHLKELETQ
jgi:hypothetical protein